MSPPALRGGLAAAGKGVTPCSCARIPVRCELRARTHTDRNCQRHALTNRARSEKETGGASKLSGDCGASAFLTDSYRSAAFPMLQQWQK